MTTKHEGTLARLTLADVVRHPEKTFTTQLSEQRVFVVERHPLISQAGLEKLIAKLTNGPVALQAPVMQLSARQPFDAAHGLVDMFMPGRWDASSDLMFMDPIVHTNPNSPGEWTGSAGYINFTPPVTGMYVVMVHFYGYQITMSLNGPAGTQTASSFSNASNAVAMVFNGSVGAQVGFSFACTGIYLGFVQSIQAFQL